MRNLLASAATLFAAALPAYGAYFTVDTTANSADVAPGDGVCRTASGDCSLQAAVEESNQLDGPDAVILPAGTYSVGSLYLAESLLIGGAGADVTTITSLGPDPLFNTSYTDLSLLDLTVAGGHGVNVGGGILSYGGHLTVINCVIRNNSAGNVGGGIYKEEGVLTVVSSTVRDNFAFNVGGGIYSDASAEIINSTISGNRAINTSGGIANEGSMRVTNCTITGNGTVNTGAGIDNDFDPPPRLVIENSVLAGNRALMLDPFTFQISDVGPGLDCLGEVSASYNLIQTNGCAITSGGGNLYGADPLLGPLQDNGGSTPTHALSAGSPAIDSASPASPGGGEGACPDVDQRFVARPQNAGCDMGAYEYATCGNGEADAGEDCDDGNMQDGDGCDSNCTATGCGNGIITAGEECDDGNQLDGDCCSSACSLSIDDDLFDAMPSGSKVYLRENPTGALKWKWRGNTAMDVEDFGDPTDETDYTLCFIDESGGAPSLVLTARVAGGSMCSGRPCWRRTGSGFVYAGDLDGPGRLEKVKLRAGPGGGSILVKGKGKRLRVGRMPLVSPVRVVLRKSRGAGTFGASFSNAERNRSDQFKATSD